MLSSKNDSLKFGSNTQIVETTLPLPTSDLDDGEISRMTKGDDTKKSSQRPVRSNFLSINSILEKDNLKHKMKVASQQSRFYAELNKFQDEI